IERQHISGIRDGQADRSITEIQHADRVPVVVINRDNGLSQCLGTRYRIVTGTTVQEVTTKSAKDDIVRELRSAGIVGEFIVLCVPTLIETEWGNVDCLLQVICRVDDCKLNGPWS